MIARRAARVCLAGTLVALSAAACGSGSSSNDQGGGLEVAEITVGTLPATPDAQFFVAQSKGFFADEGFTKVEAKKIRGGAEAMPQLFAGTFDFMFSDYVAMVRAAAQGKKLHIVAPGFVMQKAGSGIMVPPDSNIDSVADLEGKTIAVNTLKGIGALLTKSTLRSQGVNLDKVKFVAVSLPDSVGALKTGKVDAAALIEPFKTISQLKLGAKMLTSVTTGPTKNFPVGGYVTTQKFYEQHPKTVKAFANAIKQAQKVLQDSSAAEKILPTYTKIPKRIATVMSIGQFPVSLDETRLQRVPDLMAAFGQLKKRFDISQLLDG